MPRTLSALVIAFAFVLSLFAAAQQAAQQDDKDTWQIDPKHTAAQFSVRHLGISTVRGWFNKVSGSVQYDPANPGKSSIQATIEAASIDTRIEARDNDLRSPHFFEVEKYPTITFQSKKVEAAGAGKLKVTGDLTMHGVTKEVVLDVDGPEVAPKDPKGGERMGASATTKINRTDFGVNGASTAAGNDVTITLDIEMIKQAAK
jgi:polyisoprenoid-binding protein YceI